MQYGRSASLKCAFFYTIRSRIARAHRDSLAKKINHESQNNSRENTFCIVTEFTQSSVRASCSGYGEHGGMSAFVQVPNRVYVVQRNIGFLSVVPEC